MHKNKNISKQCNLSLEEKIVIITFPELDKLSNKISELISKCRHKSKGIINTLPTNTNTLELNIKKCTQNYRLRNTINQNQICEQAVFRSGYSTIDHI